MLATAGVAILVAISKVTSGVLELTTPGKRAEARARSKDNSEIADGAMENLSIKS
jgi:hypothetical protein